MSRDSVFTYAGTAYGTASNGTGYVSNYRLFIFTKMVCTAVPQRLKAWHGCSTDKQVDKRRIFQSDHAIAQSASVNVASPKNFKTNKSKTRKRRTVMSVILSVILIGTAVKYFVG
jgi:hypothetical protein